MKQEKRLNKEEQKRIEQVQEKVKILLDGESSGHGFDHTMRVQKLSRAFSRTFTSKKTKNTPHINEEVVELASLLHDVDDYKLFGEENAKNLTNARNILRDAHIDPDTQKAVLDIISTMGYNKLLSGIRPKTFEGKIVSDADMCDAIGAVGIIRTHLYSVAHSTSFFDENALPTINMSSAQYKSRTSSSSINHFFEKTLRLKDLMLTAPGKKEAKRRHKFLVNFLVEYFTEQNATSWLDYLNNYLKEN